MDNNTEDDVQNVGNEPADVVTDCLRNPVVLRTILKHFSSKELRRFSCLNKLWKSETQSVMRKRGLLTAYVRGFRQIHPQKELDAFISDLKQMNPVPFSGISIKINFGRHLGPFPIATLDLIEGVVLGQPSLKTVSVELWGPWLDNMDSPGFLLTKKLLQDSSGVLEELELRVDSGPEDFMEKVLQDFTFPRLRILKLRERYVPNEAIYKNYMKVMLSRAPKLKVLHSDSSVNLLLSVLEGSSIMPVNFGDDPFGDDATFMFSKVTALLVFARQPALAVNLSILACAVPPEMSHLKPYMSVTTELLKNY